MGKKWDSRHDVDYTVAGGAFPRLASGAGRTGILKHGWSFLRIISVLFAAVFSTSMTSTRT
jgi:hypothetical protein